MLVNELNKIIIDIEVFIKQYCISPLLLFINQLHNV